MDQSLDLLGHDARRSLELAWLHPVAAACPERHDPVGSGECRSTASCLAAVKDVHANVNVVR
jgi:hypothetical protein